MQPALELGDDLLLVWIVTDQLVAKLVVQQKVLRGLAQLVALPADEFGLERVHDGRRRTGHVDQDQAEES